MPEPYFDPRDGDDTLRSYEAEQAVLGALLLDNGTRSIIDGVLETADFSDPQHRTIFDVASRMLDAGEQVDVLTLADRLRDHSHLDAVGGLAYLATLANETPSTANAGAYVRIVRARAMARRLAHAGARITQVARGGDGRPVEDLLAEASQILDAATARAGDGDLKHIQTALGQAIDHLETASQGGSAITGLPSGLEDLDRMTAGFQDGDLIILAARPSMGKTALATNFAEFCALNKGKPAAIFSMEMPSHQIALRLMASVGRIDQQYLRTGQLPQDEWGRLANAMSMINEAPLFIDDTPALTAADLRARARRLQAKHPDLGLIVVDYLQLMRAPGRHDNRTSEVAEISRSLKGIAKELKVPILALSQLNRSLENRTDKRPMMSDLRESGGIEQDADLIMFIYRDEVYNKDKEDNKGVAEIIIGKQRNGPTGIIRTRFIHEYTRFEDGPGGDAFSHD